MKAIEVNELNASFRLSGSEATRSLEIVTVVVDQWPATGELKLLVWDEKDVPIYSQVLDPALADEAGAVEVNKRFVFYDHLSVQLVAEPPASPFAARVHFA